jgi:hypothetical protein
VGVGFGEVASGERRVTSLKRKQIPRSARNDNSGGARQVVGVGFVGAGVEVALNRSGDPSGAQKARGVWVWGRAGNGSRGCC